MFSKTLKFLAVLIVLFSTTQLGYHFWPLSSLVYGIRVDYLSPTLYFLDLLILSYVVIQFKTLRDYRQAFGTFVISSQIPPVLLVNLLYSTNPLATLSWSLHFILYFLFLAILGFDFKRIVVFSLTLSLLFQLLLALTQVVLGHSLGGLMYYLGERMIAVGSPSIATTSFMGRVVLRAYGTFSHPNILAGWSIIVLLIIVRLFPKWRVIVTVATTLIVFLTNSRSAALALFGVIIPFYLIKKTRFRTLFFYFLSLGLVLSLILGSPTPSRTEPSISQRISLQKNSLSVIHHYPIFGTGAQASISTYPVVSPANRLLQPDHNSFTLFFSWFGLFGVLALFPWFSRLRSLRDFKRVIATFAIPLLPLLLLDHYLLTSPQGLFISILYFYLIRLSDMPTH